MSTAKSRVRKPRSPAQVEKDRARSRARSARLRQERESATLTATIAPNGSPVASVEINAADESPAREHPVDLFTALLTPGKPPVPQVHDTLVVMIGIASGYLPPGYVPTREEVDLILTPTERILFRRLGTRGGTLTPDQMDGAAALIGVVLYALNTSLRLRSRPSPAVQPSNPVPNPGPVPGGPTSPPNGHQQPAAGNPWFSPDLTAVLPRPGSAPGPTHGG